MSFAEVLQRRALELDDQSLSAADERLAEERLAAHHQNPGSSIPLKAMKERLRSRHSK
jgi:hypothetical protein